MSNASTAVGAGAGPSPPLPSPAAPTGPMMYVSGHNAILYEFLRKALDPDTPVPTDPADIRVTDFDGACARRTARGGSGRRLATIAPVRSPPFPRTHFPNDAATADARLRIEVPEDALNTIRVSLKLNNFADLKA